MYRLRDIENKLFGLVGWRQSYNPAENIDDNLLNSESGLYFQDAHPFITLDNIRSIIPDDYGYQYPNWNMITNYKKGDKVNYNNQLWIALQNNQNEEPNLGDFNNDYNNDFGNPYWAIYDIVNDYLYTLVYNGISTMFTTFLQMKNLTSETKNLLEHRTFFDGAGRLNDYIENRGKICGYELVPVRSMGVTMKIEKIGLQLSGGTGPVKMYIFHSSMYEPYKIVELNYTLKNGGYQWFPQTDLYLPYISDETNSGGSWYLCYNQNELPKGVEAINISKDWSRDPCMSCNRGNVQLWRELTRFVQISPFIYDATPDFNLNPLLWDISRNIYTNTTNYGINCEISIGCDLTDFVISQKILFAKVLQLQVASIVLRTLALNPNVRVNRNQLNINRMDVLYELDGNTSAIRPGGLGYDLKKAYESLQVDTKGLDRICLTCTNGGVKYGRV